MATSGSPLVTASTMSVISHWSRANDGIEVEEANVGTRHNPSSLQEPGTADTDVYCVSGSPKINN